jgi:glycogen debranching enzyme
MGMQITEQNKIQDSRRTLWELGEKSIRELETEHGILASSRSEIYGCIFGRDSLISALALLKVHEQTNERYFLDLVRKILVKLATLQGKEVNIESGEEPGKIIHEYRPDNHAHLTAHAEKPWHLYPDSVMRSYDSVDSTPLFLMAVHAYWRESGDDACIEGLMPNIRAAIEWIRTYGDINDDGFTDYHLHPERISGGLVTQSWMDSDESLFFEGQDKRPQYPIAPVEVQAYVFVALRAWADYFLTRDAVLSMDLSRRADALKKRFNEVYVIEGRRGTASLAFAIDGNGTLLTSPRSSMGHCLWASWQSERGAMPESILDEKYIPLIVRRLLRPDLYVPRAGIRTLSQRSKEYDPNSYHNGSIWPHDTVLIAEGFDTFGFREEARRVRHGLMSAYSHFQTPLELFVYSRGRYREYMDARGQGACRVQAWSAAALLVLSASVREE